MSARWSRSFSALAAGAATLLALSACSSASSGSSGSDTTSPGVTSAEAAVQKYMAAPTTISQSVPLPKAPPRGKSMIYLTQGAVPAVVQVGRAAGVAATSLGWSFSTINYDPSSPASLQGAFASALVKKPTVVAIDGIAPDLFGASTISAYAAAGVPIIVGAAGPVTNSKTIIGTAAGLDNARQQGTVLANWFVADSKGKGKALFVHIPSFTTLAAAADGLTTTTKQLCPSCSIKTLNITLAQVGAGSVSSAVVSQLQSNPDIKYVLYDDGDWAGGISQALKAAGLSSVKVGGVTATAEQMGMLRNKTQQAWVAYNFDYNGYGLVDLAVRWLEGVDVTTNDVVQPTQILTPANVGSASNWTEPDDALAQFQKLWKVGS